MSSWSIYYQVILCCSWREQRYYSKAFWREMAGLRPQWYHWCPRLRKVQGRESDNCFNLMGWPSPSWWSKSMESFPPVVDGLSGKCLVVHEARGTAGWTPAGTVLRRGCPPQLHRRPTVAGPGWSVPVSRGEWSPEDHRPDGPPR